MTDAAPLRPGWYAVAEARRLRKAPVRVVLNGLPLVLWRGEGGRVAALEDRCPHRGAPLSQGRVRGAEIACPYHGWRFGADGRCAAMPALVGDPPAALARAFPAAIADGLVFVRWGRDGSETPAFAALLPGASRATLMTGDARTTLADIAENILDTTHTGVVHRGYLRREGGRRVRPEVVVGPDWVEARYPAEATPSGLAGRLIGGPRYRIVDRFRTPAQAEVEYRAGEALAFAIRFHLTPAEPGRIRAFARMAVAPSWLAPLQRRALALFLARIFREDRAILGAVSGNLAGAPPRPVFRAPQDLPRPGIEAILAGEAPPTPAPPPELWV